MSIEAKPALVPPLDVISAGDVTGERRIAWNVITSWAGHAVFLVGGFLLPRVIDRHIGQASLGIWDFSWSLISYFGLAGLGIGSSVNRHVAIYRSQNDVVSLRRTVSSVTMVQVATAIVVFLCTFIALWFVPSLMKNRAGVSVNEVRWVVGLLGTCLAVQMGFDAQRGVMTGCHRWDLHNGLNSASYAVSLIGIFMALHFNGGLRSVTAVYTAIAIVTEFVRVGLVRRICPELRIRLRYAELQETKKMFVFGGKVVVGGIPGLLLIQASSLMIAAYLGPAALAVYSRPMALIRNSQTLVNKFAFVLTPTAGSLRSVGKEEELRQFFIAATRCGVCFALPLILLLSIDGGHLLRIWMGPRYEYGGLIAVLAIGYLLPTTQQVVSTILIGLNLHGKPALFSIPVAVVGLAVAIVAVRMFGCTLTGAALMVVVPLSIGNGVVPMVYACRKLRVSFRLFVYRAFIAPGVRAIPFALCLVLANKLFVGHPFYAILAGGATGAAVTAPLYWPYLREGLRLDKRKSGEEKPPVQLQLAAN
jgi:O-antigen/teichoic acid export membrane protein